MINAILTDKMKQILLNAKSNRFISYEYGKNDVLPRAFGNIRINFDTFSIDLTNEEHSLSFFGKNEDITHFACEKVNPNTPFEPATVTETKITTVNKLITDIELITDTINVNNGEYQITFDVAIVFRMKNDIIMFARDTWFSELITIADNDDYDQVFSIDDVKEAWSNDGEYQVDVQRVRTKL